jgi:UDP-N-acetylmuramate: L-alanyl-gamma-D-glutamyl-meso-diaminopimelate ligase
LIITSVEFDHADIYRDLEHVKDAFRQVVRAMPADGTIIASLDHAGVRDVVGDAPCEVVSFGLRAGGDLAWQAADIDAGPAGTAFDVIRGGEVQARATVPLYGDFNVENALAAMVAVTSLGVPIAEVVAALAEVRGVKRRQELRGEERGIAVIDDFAHHPTAVRASIGGIRAQYPGRRLVAVFEPRTNTSRRVDFQEDYARSFDAADRLVVSIVPDAPIYSATGEVSERFSSERLAADVAARGVPAVAISGVDAIVDDLVATCSSGDVVLVMSNGDFGGIWEKLLTALRGRGH